MFLKPINSSWKKKKTTLIQVFSSKPVANENHFCSFSEPSPVNIILYRSIVGEHYSRGLNRPSPHYQSTRSRRLTRQLSAVENGRIKFNRSLRTDQLKKCIQTSRSCFAFLRRSPPGGVGSAVFRALSPPLFSITRFFHWPKIVVRQTCPWNRRRYYIYLLYIKYIHTCIIHRKFFLCWLLPSDRWRFRSINLICHV